VSDSQLPPDMDMLLMDLQKLQKRIHCLHNEMNSLDESYQKLNKQLDQSKKEYQLVHEVLEYCLLNDVDPTYARIMLSQLEDNTEATSNTPTKRATRITNLSRFGPVQEASITESFVYKKSPPAKSSRVARWIRKLYNK
jgi:hypothetical protein